MIANKSSKDSVSLRVGDRLEATVEKVVFGGPGLCRTDRGVVFVDFAAPNDEIEIEIVSVKKDFARGRIIKIKNPSTDRTDARCEYFTQCGGCDWQHLSMNAQLKSKQTIIDELFDRNFKFSKVKPILKSPNEWNYRNRIQLVGSEKGLSYSKKRSHDSVPIKQCLIAEDSINQFLSSRPKSKPKERVQITRYGLEELSEADLTFEFSQVNSAQNENLVRLVVEAAKQTQFDQFVDLYAGAGNFSFPLISEFPRARGVGVELDPKLVAAAQKQIQTESLQQKLTFLCGSVDFTLPRLPISQNTLVVVDPPRAGMGPAVTSLLTDVSAPAMLYVSCNPMTLVRDLKDMIPSWQIDSVQPVDMFPQTSHIEVLVCLVRG